jgi:hypothetical protein
MKLAERLALDDQLRIERLHLRRRVAHIDHDGRVDSLVLVARLADQQTERQHEGDRGNPLPEQVVARQGTAF